MRIQDVYERFMPWHYGRGSWLHLYSTVPGYNFSSWRVQLLSALLGVKNASVYIVPSHYNLGYAALLASLVEKGFVRAYALRSVYPDYPKIIAGSLEYVIEGGKTLMAYAMVDRSHGYDVCYSKLLGEALERHAGLLPAEGSRYYPRVYTATPRYAYHDIPQHTKYQKKHRTCTPQTEDPLVGLPCVTAYNHTIRRWVPVPLQSIYYGFPVRKNKLHDGTSSGLGGGFSYHHAALSAVYESIERDVFLLWWYSGAQPPRIDHRVVDTPFFKRVCADEDRYTLEVHFLYMTYDIPVPTAVCVIIDPVLHVMAMGAKTSRAESVWEGAYLEALQVLSSVRRRVAAGERRTDFFAKNRFVDTSLGQKERETQVCTPEAITYVKDHFLSGPFCSYDVVAQLYVHETDEAAEFAWVTRVFSDLSARHGAAYNMHTYSFDSQWVRVCAYHVVRAYIPAFIPLHLRESDATPLSPRLQKFCANHGLAYDESTINTRPHFFP